MLQSKGKIFDDNGFIILPGEKMNIKFTSSYFEKREESDISAITLNQYLK